MDGDRFKTSRVTNTKIFYNTFNMQINLNNFKLSISKEYLITDQRQLRVKCYSIFTDLENINLV